MENLGFNSFVRGGWVRERVIHNTIKVNSPRLRVAIQPVINPLARGFRHSVDSGIGRRVKDVEDKVDGA